jgi:transcriptional/translational regulatory protein YebC/TACO1
MFGKAASEPQREQFPFTKEKLDAADALVVNADKLTFMPDNMVPATDSAAAKSLLTLIEKLEDHDDVQNVHANYDIPVELLNQAQ